MLISGSDGENQSSDGDEPSMTDQLKQLDPEQLAALVHRVRSHELFPMFEDHEVGSSERHPNKCEFGASAAEDLSRWNAWLDSHGDTRVAFIRSSDVDFTP